jgi:3-hydroxyisobutyrate dehydrogenase-like beta-hydroxyacid dehydrogenase
MKVGIVGLGSMGSGVANNLIEKGYSVVVRDVHPEAVAQFTEKGATAASSSKEVGNLCDVVFTLLPMSPFDPTLENEILGEEGVLEGMTAGKVIIDCGNTSPTTAREISQECQKKGVSFLDAPVTGGPEGASAGTLSIMVGGPPEIVEQVDPVLGAISKKVTYFGPSGFGQMAKLINNVIVAINLAAISEALVLGQKAGLNPSLLFATLGSGAAQSFILDIGGKFMLERARGQPPSPGGGFSGTKEGGFDKQLGWAFEIASELEVPLPVTTCVHELFKIARASGKRGHYEPILELWEELTGTFFSENV